MVQCSILKCSGWSKKLVTGSRLLTTLQTLHGLSVTISSFANDTQFYLHCSCSDRTTARPCLNDSSVSCTCTNRLKKVWTRQSYSWLTRSARFPGSFPALRPDVIIISQHARVLVMVTLLLPSWAHQAASVWVGKCSVETRNFSLDWCNPQTYLWHCSNVDASHPILSMTGKCSKVSSITIVCTSCSGNPTNRCLVICHGGGG